MSLEYWITDYISKTLPRNAGHTLIKYLMKRRKQMNKAQLIEAIANEINVTKATAAASVDAFINTVTKVLKKKGDVRLVGFGTFTTAKRKATTGRNPQTGAAIKIPASVQPKFKPGKALKDALN